MANTTHNSNPTTGSADQGAMHNSEAGFEPGEVYKDLTGLKWDMARRMAIAGITMIPAAGGVLGAMVAVGCWLYRRTDINQDLELDEEEKEALLEAEFKRLGGDMLVLLLGGIGGFFLAGPAVSMMAMNDASKLLKPVGGLTGALKGGLKGIKESFATLKEVNEANSYSNGGLRVAGTNEDLSESHPKKEKNEISRNLTGVGWDVGRNVLLLLAAGCLSFGMPIVGGAAATAISYGCHLWRKYDINKNNELDDKDKAALIKEDWKRTKVEMGVAFVTGLFPPLAIVGIAIAASIVLHDLGKRAYQAAKNLKDEVWGVGEADYISVDGGYRVTYPDKPNAVSR